MSANEDKKVDSKGIPLKSPYPEQLTVPALYSLAFFINSSIGVVTSPRLSRMLPMGRSRSFLNMTWVGYILVYSLLNPYNYQSISILVLPGMPQRLTFLINRCIKLWELVGAGDKLGYVLVETDGVHGATFNRAQRDVVRCHYYIDMH